ncbi:hypothetical protein [Spongiactinospora sp. TRM90649]|uniref:hypothetical protein n=1 Tax=Spongiactinospora sp. TRM90649 TaxID=3031114 RepID=UPI0023F92270|nr:hypothetical protein [Spongiactinospora sp. TRM90649]MDF5751804.1 hypothetical protein [Spongiactinospora sp. TRM90649]
MDDQTWTDWLANLAPASRTEAMALRDEFTALGAERPEDLARVETEEGVPHLARFRLLRALWSEHIDPTRTSAATWVTNTRRELDPSGRSGRP